MEDIIRNNYAVPSWDYLSHYPFGRPFDRWFGWEYTMAVFYFAANLFGDFTTVQIANISPLIMVALSCVAAFFLGRMLGSDYSGLFAACLVGFSPSILSLTMAGMCDSDSVVVFYSLLTAFSLLYAYKKRSVLSYVFAVVSNTLFLINWISGYYVLYVFAASVLALIVKNAVKKDAEKCKEHAKLLAAIFLPVFVIGHLIGLDPVYWTLERIKWKSMLVNISVAELMPISNFKIIVERVGYLPFCLSAAFPLIMLYKILKNYKIEFAEVFLGFLYLFGFAAALQGIRFILLFTVSCIAVSSYVLHKLLEFSESRIKDVCALRGVYAAVVCLVLLTVLQSPAYASTQPTSHHWLNAMKWLKENAKENSLVFTYWDPGHFISYFGFKNTGDGAHCSSYDCVVYDFDERIQDEARVMVTDNETEAVEIIKKYARPPKGYCEMTKQMFGGRFGGCEYPEEVYFIASQDLIYKYQWLSYFAGYRDGKYYFYPSSVNNLFSNPGFCEIRGENLFVYCPWVMKRIGENKWGFGYAEFRMEEARDGEIYPFYVYKIRVGVAGKYLVNYLWVRGETYNLTGINVTDKVGFVYDENMRLNGVLMVFGRYAIYVPPEIKDSILIRTLFENGRGLRCFEQVYQNDEVKLYKIKSECLE